MRFSRIRYLDWARHHFDAHPPRFNLAASGMEPPPRELLGLDEAPLAAHGNNTFGHAKLKSAIAEHAGVAADRVVPASGTSFANFLVQAALVEEGDRVLCEWPAYEPLWRTLESLGARIEWLPREAARDYVPDLARIADAFARGVKVVMLSDLHNPSATLLPRAFLRELGALAERFDAWAIVDEVYLSGVFDERVESASRLHERLVTTASLTKTYGLGPLRAGWIVAPPVLVPRLFDVFTHFGGSNPFIADEAAVRAFAHLPALAERARARRAENFPLVRGFAEKHGLSLAPAAGGFIAWMRLPDGVTGERLVAQLVEKHETLVVPGSFFGAPDHVRIGFGLSRAVVEEGLLRVERALAEVS